MQHHASQHHQPTNPRTRESLTWSLSGGLLASLCCVGPLVAILMAGGTATGALGLVRFKYEFIAVGLIVTLIGIALSLRRSKACCSVQTYRRNRILIPVVSLLTFVILVGGSNLLLLNGRVIDAASARLTEDESAAQPAARTDQPVEVAPMISTPAAQSPTATPISIGSVPVARQLDVAITSGVACAACLLAIQDEVMQLHGVQDFAFVKEASSPGYYVVRLTYDPAQVDETTLLTTITTAPGAIGGQYGTEVLANEPAS